MSQRPKPIVAWSIALLVSAAIAISYLDRQTLPWAIKAIQADFPISNQVKAALDSAFLVTYGLMYLGGGWLLDRVGTRKGFLLIMAVWSYCCADVDNPLPSSNTSCCCASGPLRFLGLGMGVINSARRRLSIICCVG